MCVCVCVCVCDICRVYVFALYTAATGPLCSPPFFPHHYFGGFFFVLLSQQKIVTRELFLPRWARQVPENASTVRKDTLCQTRQVSTVCRVMAARTNLPMEKQIVFIVPLVFFLISTPIATRRAKSARSATTHQIQGCPRALNVPKVALAARLQANVKTARLASFETIRVTG